MSLEKCGFVLVLVLFWSATSWSQFSLSGLVSDADTGESIIGAVVQDTLSKASGATDLYGFYSISVPSERVVLRVSYLGYEGYLSEHDLSSGSKINIKLKPALSQIGTAEVVGEKSNVENTETGRVNLDIDKIKSLPALLGEVDIVKALQLMPGIQSAGEGNSGLYVRGGGPDQNLILLDDAVIYNAAHLFGFFSVFNPDAVKNVELIKGGMPARYGGRLASVLDISLREGNNQEWKADGGIGLISSRLTIQGPLKKDKASIIVSGRRTYIDVLAKPFVNPESAFAGSGYYFFDLNAKINYKINDKHRVFLSGYYGEDLFDFSNNQAGFKAQIPWGNKVASARWNWIVGDKFFLNTTASISDYSFEFNGEQEDFDFGLFSGINDKRVKIQGNWFPNPRHEVKMGVESTYHTFTPNSVSASSGDTEFDFDTDTQIFAWENAGFVSDEFSLSEKLLIYGGLRWSIFTHLGPFTRYTPQEQPGEIGGVAPPLVDEYGRGDNIATYQGWEPRAALRYKFNEKLALKLGYNRNYQYIHLASLSPTGLPTDLWLPSTDILPPQIGSQYTGGLFRNWESGYELSAELYYKDMDGLVEFVEGARPEETINNNIDNQLLRGSGTSYGAELFFQKTRGTFTGWVGYTWSKTDRVFDEIDNGDPFPSRFDRRHDASLVLNYQFHPAWKAGFVFVYATGNAVTLPTERYFLEGKIVSVYGERNSFRLPSYHRADFSLTFDPSQRKNRPTDKPEAKVQSTFNFSVYNLYNRANPYFIYFGNEGSLSAGSLEVKAYQVSLFPILPSLSWNFSF